MIENNRILSVHIVYDFHQHKFWCFFRFGSSNFSSRNQQNFWCSQTLICRNSGFDAMWLLMLIISTGKSLSIHQRIWPFKYHLSSVLWVRLEALYYMHKGHFMKEVSHCGQVTPDTYSLNIWCLQNLMQCTRERAFSDTFCIVSSLGASQARRVRPTTANCAECVGRGPLSNGYIVESNRLHSAL